MYVAACQFLCAMFLLGEKMSRAISSAGMGHILGPESNVSLPSLCGLLLAIVMEILYDACRPFRPNFTIFAILRHLDNTLYPCVWKCSPK